jgi:[ribosomal protein S5]-alanine N-acetyltransferase
MPIEFPKVEKLVAQRVIIREVTDSDIEPLLEMNSDETVTRFLPYASWQTIEDGNAWLARMRSLSAGGTSQQLVVVERESGHAIGTALVFKFDAASSRVEIGYVLARAYWNGGYMREAISVLITHLTSKGVRRIEAEVNPDNTASCALLLRLGFTLEGRARERWTGKGKTYDTNLYGLLDREWQSS